MQCGVVGKSSDKIPIVDTVTPYSVPLCGFYKRSFAYFTMKERLPIIITKIIDHLSRDREEIAAEYGKDALEECKQVIGYLSKLKNEIQTNKMLQPIVIKEDNSDKWNEFLVEIQDPYYFTSTWLFAECYVYRRIREAFQLTNALQNFDPFRKQKCLSCVDSIEAMCIAADHVMHHLANDKREKEDFVRFLKMCLWGNKCDLSLSVGDNVSQNFDPLQMIEMFKDKVLVDQSDSIYEDLYKMTQTAGKEDENIIDFVCDNAGYELFVDFCFAHFLVTKKFASKIRFHVKAIPWFISDVTRGDVTWLINEVINVNFKKELNNPGTTLNATKLNAMGKEWKQFVEKGIWTVQEDEYWVMPYEYFKMKDKDNALYKDLGKAKMIFFKGDLNYRKLMGEMNWPPTTPFDVALREFFPAPLVAVRTVKADLISGLPAGIMEKLNNIDDKWMEKGDYGIIQYCPKKSS